MNRFSALVSLGGKCQTAFQIRRLTNNRLTSYFDWIGSPHEGLITTLQRNFEGCFERNQLGITPDGKSAVNLSTQLTYRHFFTKNAATGCIDPATLDHQFQQVQTVMMRRAERWKQQIKSECLLFVRHAHMSEDQAIELYNVLQIMSGGNHIELLLVLPPGARRLRIGPNIHIAYGIPLSSSTSRWQGDDRLWDEALAPFLGKPRSLMLTRTHHSRHSPRAIRSILFQVSVRYSLGHLRRMIAIAHALQSLAPSYAITFAIEGATTNLEHIITFPFIVLPDLTHAAPYSCRDPGDDRCLSIGVALLQMLAPALIVYDGFPSRVLCGAAEALRIPTSFCIKRLANADSYTSKRIVSSVLTSCISILRPHTKARYSDLPGWEAKSFYTGDICSALSVDRLPQIGRHNRKATVLVTAGGGGHRHTVAYMNTVLDCLVHTRLRFGEFNIQLLPGPLFSAWSKLRFDSDMLILSSEQDPVQHFVNADLVIAPAGYTLLSELAALGIQTVTIPQPRQYDDQDMRALTFVAKYPHIHATVRNDIDALSTLIQGVLLNPMPRSESNAPNGAVAAAQHLIELLDDTSGIAKIK